MFINVSLISLQFDRIDFVLHTLTQSIFNFRNFHLNSSSRIFKLKKEHHNLKALFNLKTQLISFPTSYYRSLNWIKNSAFTHMPRKPSFKALSCSHFSVKVEGTSTDLHYCHTSHSIPSLELYLKWDLQGPGF